MRTNKECPMYGRSTSKTRTPSSSRFKNSSNALNSSLRRSSTGGLRSTSSTNRLDLDHHQPSKFGSTLAPMDVIIDLNDNFPERQLTEVLPDPVAVAEAQAFASKSVSELLAEQDHNLPSTPKQHQRSSRDLDDDFDESGLVDENAMTVGCFDFFNNIK